MRIIKDDVFEDIKSIKEKRKVYAPHRRAENEIYADGGFCGNCGAFMDEEMRYYCRCGIVSQ